MALSRNNRFGSLGARLEWAIERQPPEGKSRGAGLLISKLQNRGSPGASYPSIGSYVKDEVRPPLDFISAASEALSVRPSWLAFGEGAPTEAEEAERLRRQLEQESEEAQEKLDRVSDVFPMLEEASFAVKSIFLSYIGEATRLAEEFDHELDVNAYAGEVYTAAFLHPLAFFMQRVAPENGLKDIDPHAYGDTVAVPIFLGWRSALDAIRSELPALRQPKEN